MVKYCYMSFSNNFYITNRDKMVVYLGSADE
jgi:hypothetical protein